MCLKAFDSDYINSQNVMTVKCRHFMFTACHITIIKNCNLRAGHKLKCKFLVFISATSVTQDRESIWK